MEDMIGQSLSVDDVVIWPDGNARYGGLKIRIGIIVRLTGGRAYVASAPLLFNAKSKVKHSHKTFPKILKILPTPEYSDVLEFIRSDIE